MRKMKVVILESCTSCSCSASKNAVPLTRLAPEPIPCQLPHPPTPGPHPTLRSPGDPLLPKYPKAALQ